jgi:hypothetical protein
MHPEMQYDETDVTVNYRGGMEPGRSHRRRDDAVELQARRGRP